MPDLSTVCGRAQYVAQRINETVNDPSLSAVRAGFASAEGKFGASPSDATVMINTAAGAQSQRPAPG